MENNIKYLLSVFLFFYCLFYCHGQSFSINSDNGSKINAYFKSNDNNLHFTTVSVQNSIFIHKIDSVGNKLWSNEFKEIRERNNSLFEKHRSNMHVLTESNDLYFSRNYMDNDTSRFLVTRINSLGEVLWTRGFQYFNAFTTSHPTLFELDSHKIRVVSSFKNNTGSNLIGLLDLNDDGSISEVLTYRDELLPSSKIHETKLSNSNLALIKNLDNRPKSIVNILSDSLSFIDGVSIEANITDIVFVDSKYYALGNNSVYTINNFLNSNRVASPIVLCFDESLELLWSRKIDLPTKWFNTGLDILGENIVVKLNGANEYENIDFLFTINENGELEDSHRFTSDDFSLTFKPIGIINEDVTLIVQEDTLLGSAKKMIRLGEDFDDLGCYLDDYCLEIEDVAIETAENRNSNLRNLFIRLDTVDFQNEIEFLGFEKKVDSCMDNFPAFPVPIFDHLDTICINSPLMFDKLQNSKADSVAWNINGSSVGQTNVLDPSGITYSEEGAYSIAQTIYQNGCANSYQSIINVIKPIVDIADERFSLCNDSTILLNAESEEAISYLWDDGSVSSERLISNPGLYEVEITDELCSQKINFNVEPFDYSLIASNLEEDTIVCAEIPFLLQPALHEDVAFAWLDGEERLERYIIETGFYELTTSLNGCSTKSEIFVEVDSCFSKVYIPNSFSPNDDGINDVFQPLGDDFEIVEFKVFDRWGNLVHDNVIPWTGGHLGRDNCPLGVYVYLLKIRNSRLNVDNLMKGSVTLLR